MNVKLFLFKKQIKKCKDLCRKCLSVSSDKEFTSQISGIILPELDKLAEIDEKTILPPGNERFVKSFAYAFKVWNWDMQRPADLYKALLKLNRQFVNL